METHLGARPALAWMLTLSLLCPAPVRGGTVKLAWKPSSDTNVAGYHIYYGLNRGGYASIVDEKTNLTAMIAGLAPGLTYYFAVRAYDASGNESAFSEEIAYNPPFLLHITAQPSNQAAIAGASVTLAVSATGESPLTFQWVNGTAQISGATSPTLAWPHIGDSNAGNYTVVVSNPWGSITSSVATLTVIDPPAITTQPQFQSVIATTAASISSAVTGTAPLKLQWYCGTTAIAGATNSVLAWANVAASNAGNYSLTVSNGAGAAVSTAAALTVLPTNTIATAAGAYNGLFFQTNADGTSAVAEATAGFLGNCVVAGNGAFSARIYVGGQSYPFAGVFDISGNAAATISRASLGLSNLTAILHLDLFKGTRQISGTISSATAGNAWTAPLVGDQATNACPQFSGVNFWMSPGLSANTPTIWGWAGGVVVNGILTLSGALGDTAAISQTVPISKDGNVPVYVNLYNNSGLLEGWLNLAGGVGSGNLTWIRPGGVLLPSGFPQGFGTVVHVTGATFIHEANQGATACAYSLGQVAYRTCLATEFTAASSYTGNGIQISLSATGSPAFNMTAMIYTDTGGSGPGMLVGTSSATVSAGTVPGAETPVTFPGASFALVSGTSYWLVLKTSGLDNSNYVNWAATASGPGMIWNSVGTSGANYGHRGKFILFSR